MQNVQKSTKYFKSLLNVGKCHDSLCSFVYVAEKVLSSPPERSLDSVARSRQESLSSVEEDDYDTLDDIDSDKNIVRTKVRLHPDTS